MLVRSFLGDHEWYCLIAAQACSLQPIDERSWQVHMRSLKDGNFEWGICNLKAETRSRP